MIFRAAPLFKTGFRPFEVTLFVVLVQEAKSKESSPYLNGFLDYTALRLPDERGGEHEGGNCRM
jgi:hypothetical protein